MLRFTHTADQSWLLRPIGGPNPKLGIIKTPALEASSIWSRPGRQNPLQGHTKPILKLGMLRAEARQRK